MFSTRIIKFKAIIVLLIILLCLNGCADLPSVQIKPYSFEEINNIISSEQFVSSPRISIDKMVKYSEKDFLFNNHCFSFYRDMDYFLGSSARYDYINTIIEEYPPQIVRTINNNGQKSMYFVYQTDKNTRLFIFFFENDEYQFTRGFPIIMKESLSLNDFINIEVGQTIDMVNKIDPIVSLYKQGYDTLSYEQIQKIYVEGTETISTVHLLKDGIINISYERDVDGEYIIQEIQKSDDFSINVIGGKMCYLIYPDDYC